MGNLSIKTSSDEFAHVVHQMLLSLGINSHLSSHKNNTRGKVCTASLIKFKNLYHTIDRVNSLLSHSCKYNSRIDRVNVSKSYTNIHSRLINVVSDAILKKKIMSTINNGIYRLPSTSYKNLHSIIGMLPDSSEKDYLVFLRDHIVTDKVKTVEQLDCEYDVYDMTVDNDIHCYSANGIIVSNCGPSIQQNRLKLKQLEVFAFQIWDGTKYLDFDNFFNVCKLYDIQTVPLVEAGGAFNYTFDELIAIASNVTYANGGMAEGIVVRPQHEEYSNVMLGRLSFKVENPLYRAKND
jgi:hypothetical protein